MACTAVAVAVAVAFGLACTQVFQEPQRGPQNTSQFELTSVASTLHRLFNLSTPLTRRTMWAAPFDELLLDESRPDAEMPMHLPTPPAPAEPWVPPGWAATPHDDDDDDDDDGGGGGRRRLGAKAEPRPQHCGASEQTCRGRGVLSVKQQRLVQHYAELTGRELPARLEAMRADDAGRWLAQTWELWRSMGHPIN